MKAKALSNEDGREPVRSITTLSVVVGVVDISGFTEYCWREESTGGNMERWPDKSIQAIRAIYHALFEIPEAEGIQPILINTTGDGLILGLAGYSFPDRKYVNMLLRFFEAQDRFKVWAGKAGVDLTLKYSICSGRIHNAREPNTFDCHNEEDEAKQYAGLADFFVGDVINRACRIASQVRGGEIGIDATFVSQGIVTQYASEYSPAGRENVIEKYPSVAPKKATFYKADLAELPRNIDYRPVSKNERPLSDVEMQELLANQMKVWQKT